MQQVILKIKGMHCPSCAMNIDGTLEEIEGVKEARTNYARSEAVVVVDEAKVNMNQIRQEIINLGYEVV